MCSRVPPVRSSTFVWRSSETGRFLCLRAGVSFSLLNYSYNGDPLSAVYCLTDLSFGKNLSMGNTAFRDTVKPLSKALGHSDGFETKHLGEEHCSTSKQQHRLASEAKQARQEFVGGAGNKCSSELLNHQMWSLPVGHEDNYLVTAALWIVVTGHVSTFGEL